MICSTGAHRESRLAASKRLAHEQVREICFDSEHLLRAILCIAHKAQQLVHMICYPDGVPEGPNSLSTMTDDYEDDVSDQYKNISRILHVRFTLPVYNDHSVRVLYESHSASTL